MIPNVDKTKDMVISFHKQPIGISLICIEGVEIERVKSVKLLGIIVTDKITWNVKNTGGIKLQHGKHKQFVLDDIVYSIITIMIFILHNLGILSGVLD